MIKDVNVIVDSINYIINFKNDASEDPTSNLGTQIQKKGRNRKYCVVLY